MNEKYEDMEIVYEEDREIPLSKLLELYEDAGWKVYTKEPDKILKAYENSLKVVSAWKDGELCGIARMTGDGVFVAYLQDILVKSTMRRRGIGKELLKRVFKDYENTRQKILVTDDIQENVRFYEDAGFKTFESNGLLGFISFSEDI